MEEVIRVGIADWKLCKAPDKITTVGLGSCVGIVLYTAKDSLCGMLHIMLPSYEGVRNNANRAKFADSGLAEMIAALEKKGMSPEAMMAKVAGGANMFQFSGSTETKSIGERNIAAVKETLAANRIPIVAEDIGADYGRTIIFDTTTKMLTIRCAGRPNKVI